MINSKLIFVFSIFFTIISFDSKGQDTSFNGSYTQEYFVNMIEDLEKRYELKFYYSSDLDSTKLDLQFSDLKLE